MNGYGDSFTMSYRCQRDASYNSKYSWPRVNRPGATSIKLWKKALKKTFGLRQGITNYTLGTWNFQPDNKWIWFYDKNSHLLYQRFGRVWKTWKIAPRKRRSIRSPLFFYFTNALNCPPTTVRATVEQMSMNTVRLTGWDDHQQLPLRDTNPHSKIHNLPIDNTINVGSRIELAEHLKEGNVQAVSNGSFIQAEMVGSAAWIIESTDGTISTESTIITSGEAKIQNPYRSELFGILGILATIQQLCNEFDVDNGSITIHCDGDSAIKRINNSYNRVSNRSQHFDVINSILSLLHSIPVQVTLHHVKGHQDRYMPYQSLDRISQLNIIVDNMAKRAATAAIEAQATRKYYSLPHCHCEVIYNNTRQQRIPICSNLLHTLQEILQQDDARQYWVRKKNLEGIKHLVDWEMRKKSLQNIPLHLSQWYSKFSSGFCGTGRMLQRNKYQDHSNCPRCNKPNEGTTHVIQCQHELAVELKEEEVEDLTQWMMKEKVEPQLIYIIRTILLHWGNQKEVPVLQEHNTASQAFRQQQTIGWRNFIEGFWSKKFLQCQEEYFTQIGVPKSATLLLSKTQRRIWLIAWRLWTDRNTHLHDSRHSIHPQQEDHLHDEIAFEYYKGTDELPPEYQPMFKTPLQAILKRSIHNKVSWIFGVWAAREAAQPAYLSFPSIPNPNTTLRFKYIQSKEKIL